MVLFEKNAQTLINVFHFLSIGDLKAHIFSSHPFRELLWRFLQFSGSAQDNRLTTPWASVSCLLQNSIRIIPRLYSSRDCSRETVPSSKVRTMSSNSLLLLQR